VQALGEQMLTILTDAGAIVDRTRVAHRAIAQDNIVPTQLSTKLIAANDHYN
jgi:hypothetical protein